MYSRAPPCSNTNCVGSRASCGTGTGVIVAPGGGYHALSINSEGFDVAHWLAARGVAFIYLSDDTFTLSRRRVQAVCREILARELDVTWVAISRVDAVDAETLGMMRRAGCIQISYGVESGAEEIRRMTDAEFQDIYGEEAVRIETGRDLSKTAGRYF